MKIDTSNIEGYAEMSAEEKLAALEGLDINVPEPDYSGYVKKEQFDKTASELAAKKKELAAKMSADEQKEQADKEAMDELQNKYDKLLHESLVSKNKAELLALGYEDKLANDTAEAMANGDLATVFKNQKKHLDKFEAEIKAEALKSTPKPGKDGEEKSAMTLEKFRSMDPRERIKYRTEHPEEYSEMYSSNEGGKE